MATGREAAPVRKKKKRLSKRDRERLRRKAAAAAATVHVPADAAPAVAPGALLTAPLRIVYSDEDIAVVDKEAGVLCHPSPGFWTQGTVAHRLGSIVPPEMLAERAGHGERDSVIPRAIVHRLDKGTTGCMAVARTPAAERSLADQFRHRGARKTYAALLRGLPRVPTRGGPAHRLCLDGPIGPDPARTGRMCVRSDGKPARSVVHVHAHDTVSGLSAVTVDLHTGRQHQIRVHCAHAGAPVANDVAYDGDAAAVARLASRWALPHGRPLLHSWRLVLAHPRPGEQQVEAAALLPDDMRRVVDDLWPSLGADPAFWPAWAGDGDGAEAPQGAVAPTVDEPEAPRPRKRSRKASRRTAPLVSDAAMRRYAASGPG